MIFNRESKLNFSIDGFYFFLGLSIILCVAHDMTHGVWHIHSGRYFPWRHMGFVPLFPAPFLIVEWLLLMISGLMISGNKKRYLGICLAALGILIDLTQHFSNHRSLIFLLLLYLCIPSAAKNNQSFRMIRYQLLIVYLFSGVNKLTSKFYDGESLVNLGAMNYEALLPNRYVRSILSPTLSVSISCMILAIEILMPILLLQAPRFGLALVVLLHGGFSLLMPGIWPFTCIMVAMAFLFLPQNRLIESEQQVLHDTI